MADLKRMTARSVVLSVLLGAHPAWASAAELVRLTSDFDIKEQTLRVALTRMVSAGDLVRSADGYRLADRLLARQRRQDAAIDPKTRPWHGDWTTVVITTIGAAARTRADLRNDLLQNRFGELREGLWLRPANLAGELPKEITANARVLTSKDDDPAGLAAVLWDLPAWSDTARQLLDEIASAADVPGRFVAAAAIVRHLLSDPVLPAELLPGDWPGEQLRQAYADFAAELTGRRDEPMEAS
ncbi:PaaX domain-containing protein, C- domain protein [Mycolicibacterium mucogenicum]|jgi:phenylacetic acid degradation operon negative regulatory protein|uniref:PaaX family transcriptional regulator C-terminal domain-containing protein n=1 Tax=Mycolicibacterium mucogenicum TaxID=56689 RepID=UPI00226A8E39|nr:PaaX family transcriptional regulator C-terminal domain-containing protein [Mycolicibacterium mucogenicum]MCX8554635.1 PaaX domain-containing protein, C- domain protein [Mycolicibacterium mucogenicum]